MMDELELEFDELNFDENNNPMDYPTEEELLITQLMQEEAFYDVAQSYLG